MVGGDGGASTFVSVCGVGGGAGGGVFSCFTLFLTLLFFPFFFLDLGKFCLTKKILWTLE